MRDLRNLFVIFTAAFVMVACGGGREIVYDEDDLDPDDPLVEPVEGTVGSSGLDDDGALGGSSLEGDSDLDSDLLNQRVIYFEYDSSNLTLESEVIIQAHAQYLRNSPATNVILEGHADERGTREYNLALGEDRARVVSDLMQALEISAGRIQSISYGEERPVSLGSDEGSWSLNRRVEILYQ